MLMSVWQRLIYFKPGEFLHPDKMDPELLLKLDRARERAGVPFVITDSWRVDDPAEHSTHELGEAVDIRCHRSHERFKIVKALIEAGFTRIGVYTGHIHADIGNPAEGFPEEVMWPGVST